MKQLLLYIAWTFVSSLLLKSGIELILDKNIGNLGPILLVVFLQIFIIFPIISAFSSSTKQ
jgi:hypothetical protein